MKKIICLSLILILSACTDAQKSKIFSLGQQHKITCYSGGKIIYDGESTGAVMNEEKSDGYYFEEIKSGRKITVSGQCIITTL